MNEKLTPDTLRTLRDDLYDWGGFEADEVEAQHIDEWCAIIIKHASAWEQDRADADALLAVIKVAKSVAFMVDPEREGDYSDRLETSIAALPEHLRRAE